MKNNTPSWQQWLRLIKLGDIFTLLLATAAVLFSISLFWQSDAPRTATIRAAGKVLATLPLNRPSTFTATGPLGDTLIEIQPGQARIARDPSPRQYCVKQGWLTRSGAIAICAPNQITLTLEGRRAAYDSLSY